MVIRTTGFLNTESENVTVFVIASSTAAKTVSCFAVGRDLNTVTHNTDLISLTNGSFQGALSLEVMVPSWGALLTVAGDKVEEFAISSWVNAGSIAKSFPFHAASKWVGHQEAFSVSDGHIWVDALETVTVDLIIGLAERRNFSAEDAKT